MVSKKCFKPSLFYFLMVFVFNLAFNELNAQSVIHFKQPPTLKKGDTIAIVAPAGFLKEKDAIDEGIELMKEWGLHVVLGKHVYDQHNHFAGTDKNRAKDMQWAMDDPKIKAIWCARGGYGTVRIMEYLDFSKFKQRPKWLIGYSDISVLHNALYTMGIESIHGFMATSTSSFKDSKAEKSMKKALFGKKITYKVTSSTYNNMGVTSGRLIGGNLSLIASLLGTPYAINPENSILFIEDIGEHLYRIDRMMMSLKLNGFFENCKGIIIGGITNVPENDPPFGLSLEELVRDVVDDPNMPILFDFPSGHFANNKSLPFGRLVQLEIDDKKGKLVIPKPQ